MKTGVLFGFRNYAQARTPKVAAPYVAYTHHSDNAHTFITSFGVEGELRFVEHPGFYNYEGMLEAMNEMSLTSRLAILIANNKYIQTDAQSLKQLYKALNLDAYNLDVIAGLKSIFDPYQERVKDASSFRKLSSGESAVEVGFLSAKACATINQAFQGKPRMAVASEFNEKKTRMKY